MGRLCSGYHRRDQDRQWRRNMAIVLDKQNAHRCHVNVIITISGLDFSPFRAYVTTGKGLKSLEKKEA